MIEEKSWFHCLFCGCTEIPKEGKLCKDEDQDIQTDTDYDSLYSIIADITCPSCGKVIICRGIFYDAPIIVWEVKKEIDLKNGFVNAIAGKRKKFHTRAQLHSPYSYNELLGFSDWDCD